MRHHHFQILLFSLYIIVTTVLMINFGIGITPDRYFIVLFAGALLIKHSQHFIHDFAPFLLILIAYDFMRGFAPAINHRVHFLSPIQITQFIFNGKIPTIELQRLFYTPGYLHWYDYFASFLYLLHFAIPLAFSFLLWFNNRRNFREFMIGLSLLSYAALITYVIYPVAPPWYASLHGYLPPLTKIFNVVMQSHPEVFHIPTLYQSIRPNLVAAIPSMHASYAFLVFLYSLKFFKPASIFLLIYTLAMWISIVYLGEHYVIDIVSGVILCLVVFKLSNIIVAKYGKVLEYL